MSKLKLDRISMNKSRTLSCLKYMKTPSDSSGPNSHRTTPRQRDDFLKRLPQMVKSSSSRVIETLHLRKNSYEAQQTRGFAQSIQKQILQANEKIQNEESKKYVISLHGKDLSHRLDARVKSDALDIDQVKHRKLMKSLGYTHSKKKSLPALDKIHEYIVNEELSPKLKSRCLSMTDLHEFASPAGRRDAENLTKWLNQTLSNLESKKTLKFKELFSTAQEIYTICFEEIVKQVSVHWKQRGQLIDVVWKAYLGLLEKALKLSLLQKERTAKEFEKKWVNIHSKYATIIHELQGIIEVQKQQISSDQQANAVLQLDIEDKQKTIARQSRNLIAIQTHYDSVKEKLLIWEEKIRVMKKLAENDEEEYEVDEIGQLILRKNTEKKVIVKSLKGIRQEIKNDPAMAPVQDMQKTLTQQLYDAIQYYDEEQEVRFTGDDFHDASTDTDDFYHGVDQELQTKLKYTQCENIGVPKPHAWKAWASRKKYKRQQTTPLESVTSVIVEASESAEQTPYVSSKTSRRKSVQLLPLNINESDEYFSSSMGSQSVNSFNPNLKRVENLLDKVTGQQISIIINDVEDQFEQYASKQIEILGQKFINENEELKQHMESFAAKFAKLIGQVKENTEELNQNTEKLHQELMEVVDDELKETPSQGSLCTPTIRSNRSRSSNRGKTKRTTKFTPSTRWRTKLRSPTATNANRRNSRMQSPVTHFAEFKLSDAKTFKKKLSADQLSPAQDLINNLRAARRNSYQDVMPVKFLLKQITIFYAEKTATNHVHRRDLAGFIYEKYSKEFGVQMAGQKVKKLVQS